MSKGNFRILCWNINGIRAAWKKDLPAWFEKESPDVLCLQETKAQQDQLADEIVNFNNYKSYFFSAEKKGYSGVAIYSKHKPVRAKAGFNNPLFDSEGRVIEMEFEKFVLFNVYFPNGGRGPERVKYKLDFLTSINFIGNIFSIQSLLFAILFLILSNTQNREISDSIGELHRTITDNSIEK